MARVTPEGKVKKLVKAVLEEFDCHFFMPVQTGFGRDGVDFHCGVTWRGLMIAFFVETKKAAGKPPTPRQIGFIREQRRRKAKVFIIGSEVGVQQLRSWLENVRNSSGTNPRNPA